MQVIHKVTLDLASQLCRQVIRIPQNDANSHVIECVIHENGKLAFVPDGTTARIVVLKPDGKQIFNDSNLISSGCDKIQFVLTEQCAVVAGECPAMIKLYGPGDTLLSSAEFTIVVTPDIMISEITSSNEFQSLRIALNRVDSAGQEAVNEAKGYAEKAKLEAAAKFVSFGNKSSV